MYDIDNASNSVYLAYGSNLNLEQMEWRCPYATVVGPVEVPGYRLVFRGHNGSAVATIEPAEDCSVPALLWEITPRCEEALDRYEGWPRLYRKELITIPLGEKIWGPRGAVRLRGEKEEQRSERISGAKRPKEPGEVCYDVDAMVYIMNEGPPLGLPGKGYLGSILAGYETAGFDHAVLEEAIAASQPVPGAGWVTVPDGKDRQFKWW